MSNLFRSLGRIPGFRRIYFNFLYYRDPPWDTGISPPELVEFIAGRVPGRALDLGCGTGTNGITLARSGWQVTGIDFAWRAIRLARQKARRAGVKVDFQVGDVTQLDHLDEVFDLVFDQGCFHSLSTGSRPAYLRNLGRLLAPGGTYLMYGFVGGTGSGGPGLLASDLEALSERFDLVERRDGTDRGERASAWFTYRQKASPTAAPAAQIQNQRSAA